MGNDGIILLALPSISALKTWLFHPSDPSNTPGQLTGVGISYKKVGDAPGPYTITHVVPGVMQSSVCSTAGILV